MEIIKRKILLEDFVDRRDNSKTWGEITANTFSINVFLTQNIDDIGLYTDIDYISANTTNPTAVDYTILIDKLSISGFTFPFMYSATPYITSGLTNDDLITLRLPSKYVSDYYSYSNLPLTGFTDSKIEDVKSYDANDIYKAGFDIDTETYVNYLNTTISGVTRVFTTGEPIIYVFDALNDSNLGTSNQITGGLYKDFSGITRNVIIDGINYPIPVTTFSYIGEAFNETNTSLSALTKEEYLFGIISPPEVKNEVFIDRGVTSVMDMHLRLSEIKNLGHLKRYGNGYYNITKQ